MRRDELFDDRQAEASPAGGTRTRSVGPIESLEDVGQVLRGDPDPGVAHADGNETGDAFDVTEIGGRVWTSLNPNVILGTRLLVAQGDGYWYALGFTPSQSSAGNVQRVTITGSGDGGYTWIEAQLGDGTPITLWNVNGNPWRDLLPNLKNVANRNKCFALNVGGTWYAIPDFSNIGRVT